MSIWSRATSAESCARSLGASPAVSPSPPLSRWAAAAGGVAGGHTAAARAAGAAVTASGVPAVLWDATEGVTRAVSPAFAELAGYPDRILLGRDLRLLETGLVGTEDDAEDGPLVARAALAAAASPSAVSVPGASAVVVRRRMTGELFRAVVHAWLLASDEGACLVASSYIDVSEHEDLSNEELLTLCKDEIENMKDDIEWEFFEQLEMIEAPPPPPPAVQPTPPPVAAAGGAAAAAAAAAPTLGLGGLIVAASKFGGPVAAGRS